MKNYYLYLLVSLFIFTSCNSDDITEFTEAEKANDTYILKDITYSLKEGDGVIDTVRYELNVMTFSNATNTTQFREYAPYEGMMDSYQLVLDHSPDYNYNITLSDSVKIPSLIRDNTIYFPADKKLVSKLPGILEKSCGSYASISGDVTPYSKQTVTGVYHRIISQASFEATCKGEKTGNNITLTGHFRSSIITTASINGSSSISVDISDIK